MKNNHKNSDFYEIFKFSHRTINAVLKVAVLSVLLSLLPSTSQIAHASEILWNPDLGTFSDVPANLVPGAKMQGINVVVYKSNPDEIIFEIQMAESFEDKPFSNKGRYLAMNLYLGKPGCQYIGIVQHKCDRLLTISNPENPKSYPLSRSKSTEWVYADERDPDFGPNRVATTCKSPWWLESTRRSLDTWAFAISITCLGLPKEFNFYGVSQIDLGQKDVAYQTTNSSAINYPFYDLAKNAAEKNKNANTNSQNENLVEVCLVYEKSENSSNYDEPFECYSNNTHDLGSCQKFPLGEVQIFKNGNWKKLKSLRGKKGTGCLNPELYPYEFEYVVNFKTPYDQEFRVKFYGKKKTLPIFVYYRITQKLESQ